jgi:hypothetical protein
MPQDIVNLWVEEGLVIWESPKLYASVLDFQRNQEQLGIYGLLTRIFDSSRFSPFVHCPVLRY